MELSAGEMFTAGFLPGLLTAGMMSVYVIVYAVRHGIPKEPKLSMGQKIRQTVDSFWGLMFPVIILGGIYSGLATPTEAAVMSEF
jgi:C4-dicarboxylate transporter DctM subunit